MKKHDKAFGPINKSKETILFEEIVKDIISDHTQHAIDPDKNPNITYFNKDDQLWITRNDSKINISKLIKEVNFNHISIEQSYLTQYENLFKNNNVNPSKEEFQQRINEADLKQQESLKDLSHAEMLAINIYTMNYFESINGLLRGTIIPVDSSSVLMNAAIASQGLNKIPDIEDRKSVV